MVPSRLHRQTIHQKPENRFGVIHKTDIREVCVQRIPVQFLPSPENRCIHWALLPASLLCRQ
jgi:hypothetical protein